MTAIKFVFMHFNTTHGHGGKRAEFYVTIWSLMAKNNNKCGIYIVLLSPELVYTTS